MKKYGILILSILIILLNIVVLQSYNLWKANKLNSDVISDVEITENILENDGYIELTNNNTYTIEYIINVCGQRFNGKIEPLNTVLFPITTINVDYKVGLYNITGDSLQVIDLKTINTSEINEDVYLNSEVYCNISNEKLLNISESLKDNSESLVDYVNNCIEFCKNIDYDMEKYENLINHGGFGEYTFDIESVILNNKGICIDKAGMLASLLRCNKIPCKIDIGYIGNNYHAWNEVYINDTWRLIDTTIENSNEEYVVEVIF